MQNTKKILVFIFILFVLIAPVFALAQGTEGTNGTETSGASTEETSDGLVPCDGSVGKPCGFNELMVLIDKVIDFILFAMVLPIAAIMFAYAGFLLITAGGEAAHARTKAKSIFTNALIGLVLAAAAWLIISTILAILGYEGAWLGLKVKL